MAEYVVVDKAKLNGDLETIGNAIRTQTEKTAKLHFPEELEREILSIVKAKPEQEKTVEITENGTVEITPDLGKVLSKIIANVNVASSGGGGAEISGYDVIEGSFTLAKDAINDGTYEYGRYTIEATKGLDLRTHGVVFAIWKDAYTKNPDTGKNTLIGGLALQNYTNVTLFYSPYQSAKAATTKEFVLDDINQSSQGVSILLGYITIPAGVEFKWLLLIPKGA